MIFDKIPIPSKTGNKFNVWFFFVTLLNFTFLRNVYASVEESDFQNNFDFSHYVPYDEGNAPLPLFTDITNLNEFKSADFAWLSQFGSLGIDDCLKMILGEPECNCLYAVGSTGAQRAEDWFGNKTSPKSNGGKHSFVLRASTDGVIEWIRIFGTGTVKDISKAVVLDPKQHLLYVGSTILGSFQFTDDMVGKEYEDGKDVEVNGIGETDILLTVWNSIEGTINNFTVLGTPYDESVEALAVPLFENERGQVLIAGQSAGSFKDSSEGFEGGPTNVFIMKWDMIEGESKWIRELGNRSYWDYAFDLKEDAVNGDLFVTGRANGQILDRVKEKDEGNGAYVCKLFGGNGSVIFCRDLGYGRPDALHSMIVVHRMNANVQKQNEEEPDSVDVYVCGVSYYRVDEDRFTKGDIIVVRINGMNGTVIWRNAFGTGGLDVANALVGYNKNNENEMRIYIGGLMDAKLFVARLNESNGLIVFWRKFGSGGSNKLNTMVIDPIRERLFISGSSETSFGIFSSNSMLKHKQYLKKSVNKQYVELDFTGSFNIYLALMNTQSEGCESLDSDISNITYGYSIRAGDWGECESSSCTMSRNVFCFSCSANSNVNTEVKECLDEEMQNSILNRSTCGYICRYQWVVGNWSECDECCRSFRDVNCIRADGLIVEEHLCLGNDNMNVKEKPNEWKVCNEGQCNSTEWRLMKWSPCTKETCTFYRIAECVLKCNTSNLSYNDNKNIDTNKTVHIVDPHRCEASKRPLQNAVCCGDSRFGRETDSEIPSECASTVSVTVCRLGNISVSSGLTILLTNKNFLAALGVFLFLFLSVFFWRLIKRKFVECGDVFKRIRYFQRLEDEDDEDGIRMREF